jgi:hypothetical protein
MTEQPVKVRTKIVRPNPVYRKKTLAKMTPVTRKVARLIGEATSVARRLKAVLVEIQELEAKDIERREEMEKVLDRMTDKDKEER